MQEVRVRSLVGELRSYLAIVNTADTNTEVHVSF